MSAEDAEDIERDELAIAANAAGAVHKQFVNPLHELAHARQLKKLGLNGLEYAQILNLAAVALTALDGDLIEEVQRLRQEVAEKTSAIKCLTAALSIRDQVDQRDKRLYSDPLADEDLEALFAREHGIQHAPEETAPTPQNPVAIGVAKLFQRATQDTSIPANETDFLVALLRTCVLYKPKGEKNPFLSLSGVTWIAQGNEDQALFKAINNLAVLLNGGGPGGITMATQRHIECGTKSESEQGICSFFVSLTDNDKGRKNLFGDFLLITHIPPGTTTFNHYVVELLPNSKPKEYGRWKVFKDIGNPSGRNLIAGRDSFDFVEKKDLLHIISSDNQLSDPLVPVPPHRLFEVILQRLLDQWVEIGNDIFGHYAGDMAGLLEKLSSRFDSAANVPHMLAEKPKGTRRSKGNKKAGLLSGPVARR